MPTAVLPIITNAGLAAAIAATGLSPLEITHVQLGTGAYTLDTAEGSPDYDRVALVTPTETREIAAGYVLDDFMSCRIDILFDPWVGPPETYTVREIGFWAGDPDDGGILFALYSHAVIGIAQRNMLDYLATFKLSLVRVPPGSVTIVFEPDISHAAVLVAAHEEAVDPHPQYVTGSFTVYAGNPNGFVAGSQGVPGGAFPTVVWDTTNEIWWVCKTTGNAAAAVWSGIGAMAGWPFWCGTSTGTANAPVLATPAVMTAFAAGTALAWKIGVGPNTGAVEVTVGAFGNWPLYKDGPAGPVALTGGELDVGNICTARFDGAVLHLVATELGTAALADATSNTGKVVAQSGAAVVGNLPIYTDVAGTIGDSGTTPGALVASAEAVMYRLGLLM